MSSRFASDPRRRARADTNGIIVVSTVVVLAMWVMVIASIIAARQAALDRTGSEGRNLAIAFADEMIRILGDVAGGMDIIAQRVRAGHGRFDIYAWAQELPLLSSATIQGSIIGPDGRLASTTLDPAPQPIDLGDQEHFRIHLDGQFQGVFIGKPMPDRITKKVTIHVTRRVDAEDGTFLGVIVFSLPPAHLDSLKASIDLGPRGSVVLVGPDNIIRASLTRENPDWLAGVGQSVAGDVPPSNLAPNGEASFIRNSDIDHVRRLYSYRRVGNYPLVVSVGLDLDEALATSRAIALTIAVIAGLATMLLAGLAAYLIREIGRRTARETELADERSKLRDANYRLEADIALRQEVEQQLRQTQEILHDAVDSISEGFVIYDSDECFVMSNEPYRRLYPAGARLMVPGTPFEEILWADLDVGWYAEAVGCEPEWLADRMHAHNHRAEPIEQRLADGRCVMVYERRMQNGGRAGLHVDITRMKATEDQLRQSTDNLNRAQRLAKIGSFERDLRTGKATWSDESYRIFGLDPKLPPPTGQEILALIHPDDREIYEASWRASNNGLSSPPVECRIRCYDGAVKSIHIEIGVMLDDEGNPVRRFGTIRDVSEVRAAQQRQRELERQLLHSQKLEALGTLAGGIAHDLNNTLMPILALSDLLMKQMPEGSGDREDLETIVQASRHGRDLVRRILAFSRDQEVVKTRVDLAATTRQALQMLRPTIPATVVISEEIGEVPPIFANAGQLQQIVVNLVTNARQAIGNNMGTITVGLSPANPRQPSRGGKSREFVRLRVADTGCGMDAATRDRVFEPFFTTKDVGEGTGLGLSVVHGIVTDHGGRIEVQSQLGKGTVFNILLPLTTIAALPIETAAA